MVRCEHILCSSTVSGDSELMRCTLPLHFIVLSGLSACYPLLVSPDARDDVDFDVVFLSVTGK
jgi:hypothetical protein